MANIKNRVLPFKIYTFVLFSKHPSLTRDAGSASVTLTPFAKRLHVSKARLVEHLEWLSREGLITDLQLSEDKSKALFYVTLPSSAVWLREMRGTNG